MGGNIELDILDIHNGGGTNGDNFFSPHLIDQQNE
jgi:hypothetical protein